MKDKKDIYFYLSFLGIFFLALFLRVYKLSLRPLHHDEGVLWYFFIRKLVEGKPMDFFFEQHGLLTYYLAAFPVYFLKTSIFSLRLSAAIFGSLIILPFLWLKKEIGKLAVLAASLVIAISPVMVFYSRFLIGYPFFDFFFVLAIVFLIKYFKNYKNIYFYFFILSLACMALINEAILVFFGIGFISLLIILPFKEWRQKIILALKKVEPKTWFFSFLSVGIIFLTIQTCFFKNWLNVFKLENVFSEMLKKASQTGQNKPFNYYFNKVLIFTDIYWIGLAIFAFLASFLKVKKDFFKNKFNFLTFFSFVFSLITFLVFSLIDYKTPWVLMMVILPFSLFAGMAFKMFYKNYKNSKNIIILFLIIFIAAIAQTYFQTVKYNFKIYANEAKNPLAYVGTNLTINNLVKEINFLKSKNKLNNPKVLIAANSYWPIPYYLRKGYSLYYFTPKNNNIPYNLAKGYDFIIGNSNQKLGLKPKTKKEYFLRDGYKVILWQIK